MKRTGHHLAHAPEGALELNPDSPQFAGLAGVWSCFAAQSKYTSVIRDLCGSNHASPSGAYGVNYGWQESDGPCGSGVFTDGTNDNVWDCGNDATLQQYVSGGLTLSWWGRLYQVVGGSGFPGLIGKGDADSSTLGSFLLYLTAGARLNLLLYSGSTRAVSLTGSNNLDMQGYFNFVAVWQPGVYAGIFVNGQVEAETTSSVPATLDNPSYHLLLCANQGGGNLQKYQFRGMWHEARLYNRAFTKAEVQQIYDPRTRWDLYRTPVRLFGKPNLAPPPASPARSFVVVTG